MSVKTPQTGRKVPPPHRHELVLRRGTKLSLLSSVFKFNEMGIIMPAIIPSHACLMDIKSELREHVSKGLTLSRGCANKNLTLPSVLPLNSAGHSQPCSSCVPRG